MKSLLSVKQVVQRINGSVSTKLIYRLCQEGRLKTNRALGKLLIEEESLVALIEGARDPPVPEEPPPKVRPRGRPKKKDTVELW